MGAPASQQRSSCCAEHSQLDAEGCADSDGLRDHQKQISRARAARTPTRSSIQQLLAPGADHSSLKRSTFNRVPEIVCLAGGRSTSGMLGEDARPAETRVGLAGGG